MGLHSLRNAVKDLYQGMMPELMYTLGAKPELLLLPLFVPDNPDPGKASMSASKAMVRARHSSLGRASSALVKVDMASSSIILPWSSCVRNAELVLPDADPDADLPDPLTREEERDRGLGAPLFVRPLFIVLF